MFLSMKRTPEGWQGTGPAMDWHLDCFGVRVPLSDDDFARQIARWRRTHSGPIAIDLRREDGSRQSVNLWCGEDDD